MPFVNTLEVVRWEKDTAQYNFQWFVNLGSMAGWKMVDRYRIVASAYMKGQARLSNLGTGEVWGRYHAGPEKRSHLGKEGFQVASSTYNSLKYCQIKSGCR